MTITSVRIYYNPEDERLKKMLNQTHWGFAEWFECRLKPIKELLRGPEAKGVNIVNFMLYENPTRAWRLNAWGKRMNSFEYDVMFDFRSLQNRDPIENIESLMQFTSEIALRAPWPQVVAVAGALGVPLSDDERANLLPYLQWPRLTKYSGINKKLDG
jgi:hypothetical protein